MVANSLVRAIEDGIKRLANAIPGDRHKEAEQLRDDALRTRIQLASRGDLLRAATSPLSDGALSSLTDSGDQEPNEATIAAIAEALGDIGTEDSVEFLIVVLQGNKGESSSAAAASLGEIGGTSAATALVNAVSGHACAMTRIAAITAIEGLAQKTGTNRPAGEQTVLKGLLGVELNKIAHDDSQDPFIRTKAKTAMELAGIPTASPWPDRVRKTRNEVPLS